MVDVTGPLRAGALLPPDVFEPIRRRAIFDCCKWDPQFEDVATLSPFPIVIGAADWQSLAHSAESLARETLAVEDELLRRPDLHRELGLPSSVRRVLRQSRHDATPGIARTLRFDFHPTPDGWRISEVNSDVPGGFIEAQGFTALVAEAYPHLQPTGRPATALAEAVASAVPARGLVGLVHATAYTDDRQVMIYLERELRTRGLRTRLLSPQQLCWRNGLAALNYADNSASLDALVRFYPAEWLPALPRRAGWTHFFASGRTPLCNPGSALLTQSKRWPLLWDRLQTSLPMWRKLLPETRAPRRAEPRSNTDWVLKPALGRVGEDLALDGVTPAPLQRRIARAVRWFPRHWVAQRRFESVPVVTPLGPMHVCLGVFVIDGRAAGIYGRMARVPLIDARAYDVAVLVDSQEPPDGRTNRV
jgi:glutathionylspermidine synthase